jgi:hypothetical protein
MYSLTARFNTFLYECMIALIIVGLTNHLTVRFGYMVHLSDSAVVLSDKDVSFQLQEVDVFVSDRYLNEDILSFNF